jgi:hypothetical protein
MTQAPIVVFLDSFWGLLFLTQPATRIFSPLAVAGLCVTIGRYWYLFKRLTAVSAGRFYRFEHIVAYSSFKAHSKQRPISKSACFVFDNASRSAFSFQSTLKTGCRDRILVVRTDIGFGVTVLGRTTSDTVRYLQRVISRVSSHNLWQR